MPFLCPNMGSGYKVTLLRSQGIERTDVPVTPSVEHCDVSQSRGIGLCLLQTLLTYWKQGTYVLCSLGEDRAQETQLAE